VFELIVAKAPTLANFRKSVMVAVLTLGRAHVHLVFIDPGVKIKGAYYRDVLLAQHLLPAFRNLAPEGCFIFQQDSIRVRQPTDPEKPLKLLYIGDTP